MTEVFLGKNFQFANPLFDRNSHVPNRVTGPRQVDDRN
jgi:hypothetical protein